MESCCREDGEPPADVVMVAARIKAVLTKLLQLLLWGLGGVAGGVASIEYLHEGMLDCHLVAVCTHVLLNTNNYSHMGSDHTHWLHPPDTRSKHV